MANPIAFRRPQPLRTTPPSRSADGFTITVTLGPFVVGSPEPAWADMADRIVAEIRREWAAQHAKEPA